MLLAICQSLYVLGAHCLVSLADEYLGVTEDGFEMCY